MRPRTCSNRGLTFAQSGWAGFVADLEILAAPELFDEFAHGFGTVGELAEAADLTATFGDGRGDGFSVNIQT